MATVIRPSSGYGGRDPWVIRHNGSFYHCFAGNDEIYIAKAERVGDLASAVPVKVYTPPAGMPYSKELWAPELHLLDGKCYIYVACDDGENANHRMYVLENGGNDPLAAYTMHGKITDPTDKWAIDGTVFSYEGERYLVWSGWEGDENVSQNLYIARMADPFTLASERVLLSTPEHEWEKRGSGGPYALPCINEGPCALQRNGRLYIAYSAAGSWCNDYCIGLLQYQGGGVLNRSSWKKLPEPVFRRNEFAEGPGHCSVVQTGEQSYLFYHAFDSDCRFGWESAHAVVQTFCWEDDFPVFGAPTRPE